MCLYIVIQLPAETDAKAAADVFRQNLTGFYPFVDAALRDVSEPGDLLIGTRRGNCSCGSRLGSLARGVLPEHVSEDAQISKLRKQGWSAAKIARWRDEKQAAIAKTERARDARAGQALGEIQAWRGLLGSLLQTGIAARATLLLRWMGGRDDRSLPARREIVPLSALDAEFLLHVEEGVAYDFVVAR